MAVERFERLWSAGLAVGAFALLLVSDVLSEPDPVPLSEILSDALEMGLLVASATGVALLTGSLRRERVEKETLARDLRIAQTEGESWRERAHGYVVGLGVEIAKQFDAWKLTEAECEVGLLMLKGFSNREIARLRGTMEATVRHQARVIYQKSDLPGRTALCAYFLEDLLPGRMDEDP